MSEQQIYYVIVDHESPLSRARFHDDMWNVDFQALSVETESDTFLSCNWAMGKLDEEDLEPLMQNYAFH
ncbi:MAG: hypothetical protein LBC41_16940 [Clostridiales bacterium]|jgi:hypothetical protein|nr:hypothetical protein [Clostridiales bacterium]